jgi:O-antigen/teichoic acid export membrane protein
MFALFALLRHYDVSSVAWLTIAWASAGSVAAIVGVVQIRVLPSGPFAAIRWLRRHRELAPRFVAEFVVSSGVSNVTLFAIGGIAGLGELGRLRAGEIALGPLTVLFAGAGLVATPEGVRLLQESPRRLVHGCRWLSLLLAAGVWRGVSSSFSFRAVLANSFCERTGTLRDSCCRLFSSR